MYSEKWAERIYGDFEYIHGTRTRTLVWEIAQRYYVSRGMPAIYSDSEAFFKEVRKRIIRMIRLSGESPVLRNSWETFKQCVKRPQDAEFYHSELISLCGDFLFKMWHQKELTF